MADKVFSNKIDWTSPIGAVEVPSQVGAKGRRLQNRRYAMRDGLSVRQFDRINYPMHRFQNRKTFARLGKHPANLTRLTKLPD